MTALLTVQNLVKDYRVRGRGHASLRAVDDVSFEVPRGTTLGVVGESGSGKSTTARLVLRMMAPSAGAVEFDGVNVLTADRATMKRLRQRMQMVFQDPRGSLDPRMRVLDVIAEPLHVHNRVENRRGARMRVQELLELVGMHPSDVDKFAHQFSGGQAQRIAIARALATDPELVVCDEAVSALDVSVQAQILNLLRRLQAELQLSYLFISHDLSVVRYMSDRVMVMRQGKVVEAGDSESLFESPQHPYTQELLESGRRGDWTASDGWGRSA